MVAKRLSTIKLNKQRIGSYFIMGILIVCMMNGCNRKENINTSEKIDSVLYSPISVLKDFYLIKIDTLKSDFKTQLKDVLDLACLMSNWSIVRPPNFEAKNLIKNIELSGSMIQKLADELDLSLSSEAIDCLRLNRNDKDAHEKLFNGIKNEFTQKYPHSFLQFYNLVYNGALIVSFLKNAESFNSIKLFNLVMPPVINLKIIIKEVGANETIYEKLPQLSMDKSISTDKAVEIVADVIWVSQEILYRILASLEKNNEIPLKN